MNIINISTKNNQFTNTNSGDSLEYVKIIKKIIKIDDIEKIKFPEISKLKEVLEDKHYKNDSIRKIMAGVFCKLSNNPTTTQEKAVIDFLDCLKKYKDSYGDDILITYQRYYATTPSQSYFACYTYANESEVKAILDNITIPNNRNIIIEIILQFAKVGSLENKSESYKFHPSRYRDPILKVLLKVLKEGNYNIRSELINQVNNAYLAESKFRYMCLKIMIITFVAIAIAMISMKRIQ